MDEQAERHVLHVDDEPGLAAVTAEYLERHDDRFEIETATSASEGLDHLAQDEYDCVVSDYDMPGQNGIEFLQAVRETYPDIPFILYTGKGSEEVASDAISAGATDYLQKESGTGQYEVLANRINNVVSQARSQQAERHLRELAENTNQILYIFNHDWSELVFINGAYEDIWGRPVEALQNDPTDFLSGIHPDDRDDVRETMNRMSGGETVQIEYRVNPSEGYERWVSLRGEPIVDETGTVVRVAGLAIDITERKRQEQELERSRDLLQNVERLTRIGGWEADTATGKQRWTDGTYAIHDLSPDSYDPTVENGIGFYHPDDRDTIEEAISRCRETGDPFEVECRLITAEDRVRLVRANGEAITEDGTVVKLRGAIQDITEQKRQQQDLERIRDFFREAERLGDIGAWEFDSTGGAFWSEGTRRIHEVDDDFQPSVETGIEFYHPDDRSAIEQAVQSSLDTGDQFDEEGRLITAEDDQRWVKVRGEPLDDGGTVRGYIQDITEQKERKRELELAETVFEHAQDAIFVVDVIDEAEFRVERVNPAYERRTGLDAKEIHGNSPRDIVGDEFGATIEARYRECVAEQAPMEYEETIPIAGDTTHWQTTLAPVVEDGTVVRLVGATRDITERKRQQQELERNRDLLRHTERVASVGAVEIDPHTEEVRWTDGTRAIHGVADDYEPGVETALDFFPPDDREAVRQDFERCLETGEPYHGEYRLQTADDETRWVEIHGEAVQEDDDTVLVRGAIQDITEYKEREQELERTRTKFKRVFEESNDAIFISDIENDRIVDCNQAAAHLVGVPRDELRSLAPSDLHPHNYEAVKEWVETVFEEGNGRTDGITCRRLDGEIIPVEMSAGVAEFDGSRCLVNNVADVSERKERERKLEQQKRRFETIFQNSNDAILILDVENDAIRNANPQAADLLGYRREELVSSVSISDVHPDHFKKYRAFLETVKEDGHGWTDEFRCETNDDEIVETEMSMAKIELDGTSYILANARDITDRKQTKERLNAYIDNASDILGIVTEDGVFRNLSQSVERILGYEPAEIEDEIVFDYVHPDDRDRVVAEFVEMVDSEETQTKRIEYRFKHANGSWQWVESIGSDRRHSTLEGYVITTRDISERKERERELKAHSTAMEASIDGIAILNDDETYAFVNQAHADIYGYDDREAFLGESWRMCYSEDELDWIQEEIMSELYETGSWRGAATGQRQDGTTFPQELSLTTLDDGGVVCVVRDITERKQREQALRETTSQLRGVVETVEAVIFIKDAEGRYQLINEKGKQTLGLGPDDEIVGLTDEDLFPPEVAEQYRADDRRVLEQGETIKREEEVPTEEGPRTHLTFKSPLVDTEGATYGVCAVSSDITERKQREQELEQKNERLEEFTSVVSHDLRNPLNVADGSLELAQKECDSEHLDRINGALDRMDALIEDLLTLARGDKTVTDFEWVDLTAIAEGCWANVETTSASLVVDANRTIEADTARLRQVFENLIRNAVEHGGDDVTVTVGELDNGFYIEDDGPGIPESERDDVFDAGYSTREKGTGFGLSIVKRAVEAHDWTIHATHSKGGGARFEITGAEFVVE